MRKSKIRISAVIITYNEIGYIENCIESVDFADEIVVVDSYSTDGTFEYLKKLENVRVIQHPFQNFTLQKSFALHHSTNDWVLFLDSDEIVSTKLKQEILNTISSDTNCVAFWFYRTFMFKNEKLKYSGWQTDKNYRLFRKSKVKFSNKKLVHETLDVNGKSGVFKEQLTHYCYKNYEDYKSKMIKYGRLKAKEAFFREKKFNYAAFVFKPLWKFVNHYFIRLGFLDGRKGVIICYLNALSDLERNRELRNLEKKNDLAYSLRMP